MRRYFFIPALIVVGISLAGCNAKQDPASSKTSTSSYGNTITYRNDQYGFSFTPFAEWKGYKVEEQAHVDDPKQYLASFTFGLPIEHSSRGVKFGVFLRIYVSTHDMWSQLSSQDLPLPGYLSENSRYVFLWESSMDGLEELEPLRIPLSDEIMQSRFMAFDPKK